MRSSLPLVLVLAPVAVGCGVDLDVEDDGEPCRFQPDDDLFVDEEDGDGEAEEEGAASFYELHEMRPVVVAPAPPPSAEEPPAESEQPPSLPPQDAPADEPPAPPPVEEEEAAPGPAFDFFMDAPPDARSVVQAVADERPDLLANSCVAQGGNNDFLHAVVDRLRQTDNRWGYNWKRGQVGNMSQDVIDYYAGNGDPVEDSDETFIIDIIGDHCGNPRPAFTDVTQATYEGGTIGRWTSLDRF